MTETILLDDDLLPTEDDVAFYDEHGWWISPSILPLHLIDAAVDATEAFYRGHVDDGPRIPDHAMPTGAWGEGIRKNDYASLRCRRLGELVRHPMIAATAARLSGSSALRLWHDQLIYKPPETPGAEFTRIGWHTDRQYWTTCSSPNMLTAWVPFHDTDSEIGTLCVIDRSKHWSAKMEGTTSDLRTQDLDATGEMLAAGRTIEKVSIDLKKGQVSFHHQSTYHASGPNKTATPRRSVSIHLQPADNRYAPRALPDGSESWHPLDRLVRNSDGVPDYSDPDYCPLLWDAGGPNDLS